MLLLALVSCADPAPEKKVHTPRVFCQGALPEALVSAVIDVPVQYDVPDDRNFLQPESTTAVGCLLSFRHPGASDSATDLILNLHAAFHPGPPLVASGWADRIVDPPREISPAWVADLKEGGQLTWVPLAACSGFTRQPLPGPESKVTVFIWAKGAIPRPDLDAALARLVTFAANRYLQAAGCPPAGLSGAANPATSSASASPSAG
ncbi:hypothetical protein [Streptomyces sp. SID3343]|uniref:hypothetical protein n=1 Tax=Streptomyces sp. SID3343 TaxID=2690260 RepID=UPI00136FAED8|nr:hypothetical protein [Streptomyces sp. SID3343]MYW04991.1 hypothetical protein [Streptomyces sp. SID3343]